MSSIVIFGAGWLGKKYSDFFNGFLSTADIGNADAVSRVLDEHTPTLVINTAGKTGRPNVDWCEDHREETIYSNITGALVLFNECHKRGIRMVHLSSGCIFNGDSPTPGGFTEEDIPNPPSFYSWTKATADEILKRFPVLILRLRMPLDYTPHDRNLLTKLLKYTEVVDTENSVTVIPDLLSATKFLIEQKLTGIFNIANPGAMKHSELLDMYIRDVDPKHSYTALTLEEFNIKKLTKARRSNCVLSTKKLEGAGFSLPPIQERLPEILEEYKKHIQ